MVLTARLPVARVLFALAVVATAWGSLAPQDDVAFASGLWDKAQHALGYAILAGLLMAGQRIVRPWRAAVTVLALGAALELLQGLTLDRRADPADLIADAVGIGLACGIVAVWQRSTSPRS